MDDDIKIAPTMRQLIHSRLAQFCTSEKGTDLYYLNEAFNFIRTCTGEQPLKDAFGDKYPLVKKYLSTFNFKLTKVKSYYDSINSFKEKEKELRLKMLFNNNYQKLKLIEGTFYNSFKVVLDSTELKFQQIPHSYFKTIGGHSTIIDKREDGFHL